jgi:hypothetical protein
MCVKARQGPGSVFSTVGYMYIHFSQPPRRSRLAGSFVGPLDAFHHLERNVARPSILNPTAQLWYAKSLKTHIITRCGGTVSLVTFITTASCSISL